jgi:hypothetical protein
VRGRRSTRSGTTVARDSSRPERAGYRTTLVETSMSVSAGCMVYVRFASNLRRTRSFRLQRSAGAGSDLHGRCRNRHVRSQDDHLSQDLRPPGRVCTQVPQRLRLDAFALHGAISRYRVASAHGPGGTGAREQRPGGAGASTSWNGPELRRSRRQHRHQHRPLGGQWEPGRESRSLVYWIRIPLYRWRPGNGERDDPQDRCGRGAGPK